MKEVHMSRYFINSFFLLILSLSFAQSKVEKIHKEKTSESNIKENTKTENDTLQTKKRKYYLRIGADISKPIIEQFNEDISGLEFVADFRLTDKIFVAGEYGSYERYSKEDTYDFNTKGDYYRFGIDYNLYENWFGMSNMIYIGVRYGFSNFDSKVFDYTPYVTNQYWETTTVNSNQTYENLNAQWGELIVGIKAEVLKNLYVGLRISGKRLFNQKTPNNFQNLYIPGFNKVYLNDGGVGFNYTISYAIPLFKLSLKKKAKTIEVEKNKELEKN